ncbi:MAG: hypothetical protein EXR98_21745 [Gemmataceae bacterium]|nr:hypothetical protein [Gemmataceae bacterium]
MWIFVATTFTFFRCRTSRGADVATDLLGKDFGGVKAFRHAVIWRKFSFGTQSTSGSQFVERLLPVIETCRSQCRNVFSWLVAMVQAHYNGQHTPSLLPTR